MNSTVIRIVKHDSVFKKITVEMRIWTTSENSTAVATTLGEVWSVKCLVLFQVWRKKWEI